MEKYLLILFAFLVISCADKENTNNSETSTSGNPELDKRVNYSGYTSVDFEVISPENISEDPNVIRSEIQEKMAQEFNKAFEIARASGMFVNKPELDDALTWFDNVKIYRNGPEIVFSSAVEADLKSLVSAGGSLSVSGSVIVLDIKADLYGKDAYLIEEQEDLSRVYISKNIKFEGKGNISAKFDDILDVIPKTGHPKVTALVSLISLLANGGNISSDISIGLEQRGISLVDSSIDVRKIPKQNTSVNRLTEIFFENVAKRVCRLQDKIHGDREFNCNIPYDTALKTYKGKPVVDPSGQSLHLPDLLLPMIGCVETNGVMHYVFSRPAGVKGFSEKSDPKFFELKDNGLNSSSPERFTNFTHAISNSTPILELSKSQFLGCDKDVPAYVKNNGSFERLNWERECLAVPVRGEFKYSVSCDSETKSPVLRSRALVFKKNLENIYMAVE